MQAQRKYHDPATATRVSWPGPEEDDSWSPRLPASTTGQAPSPAHLMWDELATRLQAPATTDAPAIAVAPATAKWPMPVRLGVIAALSAAAWGVVYLAALAII